MQALVLFGLLAFVAVLATWCDEDLRWIGLWLFGGFALSNILHAHMRVSDLTGPYSLIEFMVLVAVSVAWASHRSYWPLLLLGAVNILSICINVAFAVNYSESARQIYLFELTTNMCFVAECMLATGVGLVHGHGIGRFARLSRLRRRSVAADASSPADRS